MFFEDVRELKLSGERFLVTYKILGDREKAKEIAKAICIEQTVEFPAEFVPKGVIHDEIVGHIESFYECDDNCFIAKISYAVELAGREITQLLNVVFGNSSIKPGIRVENIELPDSMLKNYSGPRFGRSGLRSILNIQNRPLLFTALKPMGLSSKDLADLAYKFALGGIDIIKDDHGISNQSFSPFEERVKLCTEAVRKANEKTGYNSIYVPNITAPYKEIKERAKYAKEMGAGGLLISPGLTGVDVIRDIAEDESIGLPIFSHPAFQGSYVLENSGISHAVLFGFLNRLAGADAVIYPNYGGRFSFSREECKSIADATGTALGHIKTIFPCPAGGMSLQSIPDAMNLYGKEVIFLIGGGLFKNGPDLIDNCHYFRQIVENRNV